MARKLVGLASLLTDASNRTASKNPFILNELLKSDDRLYDYFHALGVRADDHGLESLSDPERAVLVSQLAYGIVGNGGFRYYYEGANEPNTVSWSMTEIGLPHLADAAEKSAIVLPSDVLMGSHDVRCDWMDNHEDVVEEFWEPLNTIYWNTPTTDLFSKIRAYLVANAGSLQLYSD